MGMRHKAYLKHESVAANSASEIRETYNILRSQIQHENELYNQRIIWLITIQALLYATIGLIL